MTPEKEIRMFKRPQPGMKWALVVLSVFVAVGASAGDLSQTRGTKRHSCAGKGAGPEHGHVGVSAKATAQSNFYQWVNRDWLNKTPIPADKPRVDNFTQIEDRVNGEIKNLLTDLQKAPARNDEQEKLVRLYTSFLDMETRNGRGLAPIASDLSSIEKLKTHKNIARRFAEFQKLGIGTPLVLEPMGDFKNSKVNIAYVSQAGLGMEREYYKGMDPQSVKQRDLYTKLLLRLFELASIQNPAAKVDNVLALESQLADIQWSRVQNRDMAKIYNNYSLLNYYALTRNLYGKTMISTLGIPAMTNVIVMQPSYIEAYADLFPKISVQSWKDYLTARLLTRYAGLLTSDFKKALVDYEIALGLFTKEKPTWEQGIDYLTATAGHLLGRAYVERYFKEDTKAAVSKLVYSIRDEYKEVIGKARWMTEPTRARALEKLDKVTFQIGAPDKWRDFSGLRIATRDLVGNSKNVSVFEHKRNMAKVGQPVDPNEWGNAPHEINAYYDPTSNKFVLLAGILHPPFFDIKNEAAANYGGMGFVIGHEIGHGFDDQGSRFDGDGNMKDWWTEADNRAYGETKRKLIAQANAYEILPGTFLKGEMEIGEIMGDLGGAQISLGAFRKVALGSGVSMEKAEEAYFIQLAETWRSKWREEYIQIVLQSDPHPPSEFRANGIVRQFNEFYPLFKVKPGDKMYLPSEKRVLLW
jgi:putative endopeptidase